MRCIKCGGVTRLANSINYFPKGKAEPRRRLFCTVCNFRFNVYETEYLMANTDERLDAQKWPRYSEVCESLKQLTNLLSAGKVDQTELVKALRLLDRVTKIYRGEKR